MRADEPFSESRQACSANLPRFPSLLSLLLVYRRRLALATAAVLSSTALGLVNPLLFGIVMDRAIAKRDLALLGKCTALIFCIPLIGQLIRMAYSTLVANLTAELSSNLRRQLFQKLQQMPFSFYTTTRAGEILGRLSNDVRGLEMSIVSGADFLSNALIATGTTVAMFYISPVLTFLVIIWLPFVGFCSYKLTKHRRASSRAQQAALDDLFCVLQETLSVGGVLLMKAFGREDMSRHKFEEKNQRVARASIRLQLMGRRWDFASATVTLLLPSVVILITGWQMIKQIPLLGEYMTVGKLLAFATLQTRFSPAASRLILGPAAMQPAIVHFERISHYLAMSTTVTEHRGATSLDILDIAAGISFDSVSFAYPATADIPHGTHSIALQNVSFTIKPGAAVALVGPSGAGKTTIAYLLSRLYDPDTGNVRIGKRDIREVTLSSLHQAIGIVTQDAVMFHASIRENILYARPDAAETEMVAAATAAGIHSRISEFPAGYDTIIGERGYKLSGGEKQRIAIARIFLKNPPILILDEATSSLDNITEMSVQIAFRTLMEGRTSLIIAHRLSTVIRADLILVMDRGQIVERGTHNELLASGGMYSRLYRQTSDPTDALAPHLAGA